MSPRSLRSHWRVTILRMVLFSMLTFPALTQASDDVSGLAFFEAKIRPALIEHCDKCHSQRLERPKGGLRVDTRDGLLTGGESGPALVPGKPDESLIVRAIEHQQDVSAMPPKQTLPPRVIADIREWVARGAPDPRVAGKRPSTAFLGDRRDWWSLRPLNRPRIPNDQSGWSRTPIDSFIVAELRKNQLTPAPEADRRTLIRRLSLDLTGLPPTFEETSSFLADRRPDAYEQRVDRLLGSPHYGERWARHWMDAVHFAETHGHDQDRVREHAWPYRDYLVRSFNADTPYAKFVQEQVAADAFFPEEPGKVVALGFLSAGPWDESSLRDIREDSIDRQIGRYLDRDDVVTTVMSTFVSSTVHCARCHDHKFDPISQDDYYALQAVFAGVDRADREFDTDPEIFRRRNEWTARLNALRTHEPAAMASLDEEEMQRQSAVWETELSSKPAVWETLEPLRLTSSGGATLTLENDGSILSTGTRPAKETVTILAPCRLNGVTAIRLEVLSDDRLPSKGPGRNDNGNFHLTEFRVSASPRDQPESNRLIPIRIASADFEQQGWGIAAALDGNPKTAWGIFPEVGKSHQAIFQLESPITGGDKNLFTIVLEQSYPESHPIGRFRLSVTQSAGDIRVPTQPDNVARILSVPTQTRTREQRRELALHVHSTSLELQLRKLPPRQHVYAAASEFAPDGSHRPFGKPRPVHLLRRGDIHQPGKVAESGTLGCVAGLPSRFDLINPADEAARRAALALWITDRAQPLTWRSIVNRIWHHHFGRGIVDSPNDFGRMGSLPSHPDLLDWMAVEFRDGGGSLKQLHRLIVTSAVYRQSTRDDTQASAIDSDNRLLWRQNRRKLDAESVRDAILLVSGRLDRLMAGPSVRQFSLRPGVHVTPVVDYSAFDWDASGANRRSVYRFLFRTLPDPFMDALDAADASQLTAARTEAITPLQALALWNDPFVLRQCDHLASRIESQGADVANAVRYAFRLTLNREPADVELREMSNYVTRHGLANSVRILLNSTEFMFVD